MEALLPRFLVVAVQGEAARGSGGVVFTEGEEVGYLLLHELPEAMQQPMADALQEDGGKHFFILHKLDGHVHVSKLARLPGAGSGPALLCHTPGS